MPQTEQLASMLAAATPAHDILPKFSAAPNDDIEDWIIIFNAVTSTWNEDRRIQHLGACLRGPALSWYAAQLRTLGNGTRSWDLWTSALRTEFGSSTLNTATALVQRIQRPGECPLSYCRDVLNLCSRVNACMTEAEKLGYLMKGLFPDFREKIVLMCPSTSQDFIVKLQTLMSASAVTTPSTTRSEDSLLNIINTLLKDKLTVSPSTSTSPQFFQEPASVYQSLQSQLNNIQRQITDLSRQNTRGRNVSPRRASNGRLITCFCCGQQGHMAFECSVPRPDSRRRDGPRRFHALGAAGQGSNFQRSRRSRSSSPSRYSPSLSEN